MKENKPEHAAKENPAGLAGGRVRVGGFGKHPAWNDFPDSHLGQETGFLARAEKELFLGAIRKLVDAKKWDGAAGGKEFLATEWCWLWQVKNEFLLGLLWPSQDGTSPGRKFPMWLCVDVEEVDVFWALENLLPVLSRAAKKIRELKAKVEVLQCVQDAQNQCAELLAKSTQRSAGQYLARADQLAKESWLGDNPDALPRALYFMHTRLPGLAIGAKEIERRKREEFEAMRLPVPAAGGPGHLGEWLAFLRTQIDNETPILLVHSLGSCWCDAIFGGISPEAELSLGNTLRLKQNLEGVPLITEIPYPLDADFRLQTRQTLDAVVMGWGIAAKRSIFGPVPASYRPCLPGEKLVKNPVAGFSTAQLTKKISTLSQTVGNRVAAVGSSLGGKNKWVVPAVGGILVVGFLVLLAGFFFRTSSEPAKKHNPIALGDQQKLKTDWSGYVADYTNWLKPLVADDGAQKFSSPYLKTNLSSLVTGAGLQTFDALKIYGSADTLNYTEPDLNTLSDKKDQLQRAYHARDQVKSLLQEKYPAKVAADVQALASSPLAAATRGLLPEAGTNLTGQELVSQAERLEPAEKSMADLALDWQKWERLKATLTRFDTNNFPRFLAAQEQSLATANSLEKATRQMTELRRADQAALDWLQNSWSSIDQPDLQSELAQTNLPTLAAWTNLAADYTRIFTNSDPRTELRDRVQEEMKKHVNDVVEEAKAGNSAAVAAVADLNSNLSRIQSELAALTNTVAIRKNQAGLGQKTSDLSVEIDSWARAAKADWDKVFDFNTLMKQQRAVDYGNARANSLWAAYLSRAEESTRGQTLTREALLRWRTKFEQAGLFFTKLAGLKTESITAPLLNDPALSRQPEVAALAAQVSSDYCAQIVKENQDADLGMARTFDEFSNSQEKAALDQSALNFTTTLAALLRESSRIGQGTIPRDLNEFRENCRVLAETHLFPTASQNPRVQGLLQMNATLVAPAAGAEALATGFIQNPPPDFLHLALLLARLNEFADWPSDPAEWNTVTEVEKTAQKLTASDSSGLDKSAAAQALVEWLGWQWKKASPKITTLAQINACMAVSTGLNLSDLPKNLLYNHDLATLAGSFDGTNAEAFKKQTQVFLQGHKAAAGGQISESNRIILDQILKVPDEGTDENALAPKRLGLEVTIWPDGRARVVRNQVTNAFKLMEASGIKPVYVSVSEFSCHAFLPFVNQTSDLFTKWLTDLTNALGDVEGPDIHFFNHPFDYLNNLTPNLNEKGQCTGLRLRESRMEVGGNKLADSTLLHKYSRITGDMPVNFVSPNLAEKAAEAWGCRFLTPEEWSAIDRALPPGSKANSGHAVFQEVYHELEQKAGGGFSKVLARLFFTPVSASSAADSTPDDTGGLMLGVDDPDPGFQQGGLIHWRGNVAEFLQAGGEYFVAGGSFASGQGANADPQPVPANQFNRSYADVGFRLAFSWAGLKPADAIRALLAELKPVPAL